MIAFITRAFGLNPVNARADQANPLDDVFDFGHSEEGFVSYRRRPLQGLSRPEEWFAKLLSVPVPEGEQPVVPRARPLCPPSFEPGTAVAAGLGAAAVTAVLASRDSQWISARRG